MLREASAQAWATPASCFEGPQHTAFGDADADGSADILQENHYYPFGMAMTYPGTSVSAPPTLYQYNGKELQDELDLGWYDYGARMYDASIGKWNGVDPLAELYLSSSPYAYVMNNPLNLIDPTGMSAEGAAAPKAPGTDELSPGEKRRKMRRDKRKYGGGLSDDQKKDQADAIKGTAIANSSLYKGTGGQSWDSGGTLPSGLNPNSNRDGGIGFSHLLYTWNHDKSHRVRYHKELTTEKGNFAYRTVTDQIVELSSCGDIIHLEYVIRISKMSIYTETTILNPLDGMEVTTTSYGPKEEVYWSSQPINFENLNKNLQQVVGTIQINSEDCQHYDYIGSDAAGENFLVGVTLATAYLLIKAPGYVKWAGSVLFGLGAYYNSTRDNRGRTVTTWHNIETE